MMNERDMSQQSMLRVARAGFARALLALFVISGLINLLALTGSIYMLQVYDRVLTSRSVPTLVTLTSIVAVVYVFLAILDILRNQASARTGLVFERRLSATVLDLVLRGPLLGLSRAQAQQPIRDMDAVRSFLASGGAVAFLDLPWMPLYLGFVFLLHPALGLLCLAGLTLILALTLLTERFSKPLVNLASGADSERRALADTSTRNAESLQAMGITGRAVQRLEQANRAFLSVQTRSGDVIALLGGISRAFRLFLQSAILGLGAYLTIQGEVTAGAIIAASIASARAIAPLEQVIIHWRSLVGARAGYARLRKTLAEVPVAPKPLRLPPPRQTLTLKNVSVTIPGTQRLVLHDIDFELRQGQALAVVGPSAAGKSSLARTITGVWPIRRGSIRLDGAEFDRWTAAELGRHIGYLPQELVLFEGTVADNISRLEGNEDSEAIVAAARAAGIHEMILGLPAGYETRVGPDGASLSAGQRQRIALARALFRNPFLVVLDEPNSNLDADGEAALTRAIHGIRERGGIAIVVAHRPSALAAADLALMLNQGQLTDFGPTDDVLKRILRQPLRAVAPARS
jgi:ATP-binding cassette, subfamily C, type I secretion system permease/ATPase